MPRFANTLWPALLSVSALAAAESHTLVAPEWIEKNRRDPHLVLLDARPEAEYLEGHVPGALVINAYDNLVDTTPQGERAFQAWLTETLGKAGLGPKDVIVVYDNKLGMRAARAYWMLCYAGQPTVFLLEGGMEAWRRKNRPVETAAAAPRAATRYHLRPEKQYIATERQVAASLKDGRTIILDVRTHAEYEGQGGVADCARQGRIPGAVWIEWTEWLSPDGTTFAGFEKLGTLLIGKGILPNKQIIVYCHRGARAAMVWAVLDDLGYPKVRNYIGSWHEWAGRPELPAEKQ
ncbi:MAG TPA: rhodanese-like domain-containing protein [Bryobacterales bacterium]|nr:rhodanese-like domain-containing protein [Bryobacterales bacterium]